MRALMVPDAIDRASSYTRITIGSSRTVSTNPPYCNPKARFTIRTPADREEPSGTFRRQVVRSSRAQSNNSAVRRSWPQRAGATLDSLRKNGDGGMISFEQSSLTDMGVPPKAIGRLLTSERRQVLGVSAKTIARRPPLTRRRSAMVNGVAAAAGTTRTYGQLPPFQHSLACHSIATHQLAKYFRAQTHGRYLRTESCRGCMDEELINGSQLGCFLDRSGGMPPQSAFAKNRDRFPHSSCSDLHGMGASAGLLSQFMFREETSEKQRGVATQVSGKKQATR